MTNTSSHTVAIIGAAGAVGAAAVKHTAKGDQHTIIKALSRTPDALPSLPKVVNVSSENLANGLDGVHSAFLCVPGQESRTEIALGWAKAALVAGVEHVVVISVDQAADPSSGLFGKQFAAIEEGIKALGFPMAPTVLRCPLFLDNLWGDKASIESASPTMYGPVDPDVKHRLVATDDVGAAAAAVLANPAAHAGQTYSLAATPASKREMAAEFSKRLGTAVEYVQVPNSGAFDAMVAAGFPAWQAGGVLNLTDSINAKKEFMLADTTAHFIGLTGRAPQRADEFIDHLCGLWARTPSMTVALPVEGVLRKQGSAFPYSWRTRSFTYDSASHTLTYIAPKDGVVKGTLKLDSVAQGRTPNSLVFEGAGRRLQAVAASEEERQRWLGIVVA